MTTLQFDSRKSVYLLVRELIDENICFRVTSSPMEKFRWQIQFDENTLKFDDD